MMSRSILTNYKRPYGKARTTIEVIENKKTCYNKKYSAFGKWTE